MDIEDITNPAAYIEHLKNRGFSQIPTGGKYKFKCSEGHRQDYSAAESVEAAQYRGVSRCVRGCYVKDHGIFTEIHHVGVANRYRVLKEYRLCKDSLDRLRIRLNQEKKKTLKLRIALDDIEKLFGIEAYAEERQAFGFREKVSSMAAEKRGYPPLMGRINRVVYGHPNIRKQQDRFNSHLKRLGALIHEKCKVFMEVVSMRSLDKLYFRFDLARTKGQAEAYAKFLSSFQDIRSIVSMKDSGGDRGGKRGPSRKQEMCILKKAVFHVKSATLALNYVHDLESTRSLDKQRGYPDRTLQGFIEAHDQQRISTQDWADVQAYKDVMNRECHPSTVRKIRKEFRQKSEYQIVDL